MLFDVHYLGGEHQSMTINFSRPSHQVLLQFFQFLRMGEEGYRKVHRRNSPHTFTSKYCVKCIARISAKTSNICQNPFPQVMTQLQHQANKLREKLSESGAFVINCPDETLKLPIVAFSLADHSKFDEFEYVKELERMGWQLPAYEMPVKGEKLSVLIRIVVRRDLTDSLSDNLIEDMMEALRTTGENSARRIWLFVVVQQVFEHAYSSESEVECGTNGWFRMW